LHRARVRRVLDRLFGGADRLVEDAMVLAMRVVTSGRRERLGLDLAGRLGRLRL